MSKEVKSRENMKWIERMALDFQLVNGEYVPEKFHINVPKGAEFIGAQHDAKILVMLVRDRFGATNPGRSNRKLEERTVIRAPDGMMLVEEESRYIGSDNGWHLFEVGAGLKFSTKKAMNVPAATNKEK